MRRWGGAPTRRVRAGPQWRKGGGYRRAAGRKSSGAASKTILMPRDALRPPEPARRRLCASREARRRLAEGRGSQASPSLSARAPTSACFAWLRGASGREAATCRCSSSTSSYRGSAAPPASSCSASASASAATVRPPGRAGFRVPPEGQQGWGSPRSASGTASGLQQQQPVR